MVKLTVYGFTWPEAVGRLDRSLRGFLILGVKTTIPYFQQIVHDPDFIAMNFDTSYINDHPQLMEYQEQEREVDKIARLIAEINAFGKVCRGNSSRFKVQGFYPSFPSCTWERNYSKLCLESSWVGHVLTDVWIS
jgi:pyruvate carboxylase